MKNKQLKALALLCFLSNGIYAQSTINATGGGGIIGNNSYEYSIGEMTIVSTYSSPSLVVTQGVLQPFKQNATVNTNFNITQDELRIYPNLTSAIVYIKSNFKESGILKGSLYDVNGSFIQNDEWKLLNGAEINQLDISHLAQGNYYLHLNFNNKESTSKIQVIK